MTNPDTLTGLDIFYFHFCLMNFEYGKSLTVGIYKYEESDVDVGRTIKVTLKKKNEF